MGSDLHRASLYFRYIREEHTHHREVFERGKKEMLSALKHVRVDPAQPKIVVENAQQPPPREESKNSDPAPVPEDQKDAPAADADLRKLYRKIVHETHPDKVAAAGLSAKESEKRIQLYKLATEGSNKLNEDILVEVALDLEIDTGLDESRIEKSLRNRAQHFANEISQIKNSVEWFWVNAPEDEKIRVVKEICNRNGWIYVTDDDIVECVRFATGVHPGSREEVMRRARERNQKRRSLA